MGQIKDTADSVYRDFIMDGVPLSGKQEPKKGDIRDLFRVIDAAVATAQAGIATASDIAARDAFYADVDNQSKLVYVNNNNGSASDPANGVYEYVGGGPRIAIGFYQGVASVVQPLVDEAEAAVTAAEIVRDEVNGLFYESAQIEPGGSAGAAQAANSRTFIAKTFGELGLVAPDAELTGLSFDISAYNGTGTGEVHVVIVERNGDGTWTRVAVKAFSSSTGDAVTTTGPVFVAVADLALPDDKVKANQAIGVYSPTASGLSIATTNDPGGQYVGSLPPGGDVALDAYNRSPSFTAEMTFNAVESDIDNINAEIQGINQIVTISEVLTTAGAAAADVANNSTYIAPSFRELGLASDTAELKSLLIRIAEFDNTKTGDIHVYFAEQVSANVFKRVSTTFFLGGISAAGEFDVPIASLALPDNMMDADWHLCTYTPSLSSAGVTRAMVDAPGWRYPNASLPIIDAACEVMASTIDFEVTLTYAQTVRDDDQDARISAQSVENDGLIAQLELAYQRSGIEVGSYTRRPALKPLEVTYFYDTDYGGLIKGWGSTWYDALSGEELPWWAPGAAADFDFENDRYMMGGVEVSRATAIATDISARISSDGVEFTGTLGEQVQAGAFGPLTSSLATGASAVELLMAQSDDTGAQTIIEATAAANAVNNRYVVIRRSGDDLAHLQNLLQLNVYANEAPSTHQLRQGQSQTYTPDAVWMRVNVAEDDVSLQDRDGGVVSIDAGGSIPLGLARFYYGGRSDGSTQPFIGTLKRAIHWIGSRKFDADFIRNLQQITINGSTYTAEAKIVDYAIRFDNGLPSGPLTFETRAGDQRPDETDRSRAEIGLDSEATHEVDHWAAWSFKPVTIDFPGSYFITCQMHPDASFGEAPSFRIDRLEDGSWTFRANYVAADAVDTTPVEVVNQGFDIPDGEWSWFVLKFRSSETGEIKLWANGELVVDYTGPYGYLQLDGAGYIKFGNYSGPTATGTSITKIANARAPATDDLSALITAPDPIVGESVQ